MRKLLRGFAFSAGLLLVASSVCAQGVPPAITSINPSTVTAGGPSFTLTVNGSGFAANSAVQVNGVSRATTFGGPTLLMTTIFASDIATPTTLTITVFNPVVGTPGATSIAVPLAVAPAPAPSLSSVSPPLVSQGGNQLRMTLVGANFRLGAAVIISPANTFPNPALTQAADLAVQRVQFVSGNLLIATVSLAPNAAIGVRSVDVRNTDGTTTEGTLGAAAGGTTKPVQVSPGTSLGAPLSVTTVALLRPRNGALISQGDAVYGQAILAGTGTGTVIGEWLWDGNVTEQFTATFAGGERVLVRTQNPFPAGFLGEHTVELRIVQPNLVLSPAVHVIVNPGQWNSQVILGPPYGSAYPNDGPPLLRWAPVPGAVKYQVGFSTRPYFSSISAWHDVTDNQWQVPKSTWNAMPTGELYWTVRTIDASGSARKPLPMRPIIRLNEGALLSSAPLGRTPAGNPLLAWQPLGMPAFYQVTISQYADGTHPLRVYLTKDPRLDLRALAGKLVPGETYSWRVRAILPDGRLVYSGPIQSFVAPAGAGSAVVPEKNGTGAPVFMLVSARRGRMARAAQGNPSDLAFLISSRAPMPDSTVNESKPVINIQFNSAVNPADLSLMVDDTDVTSLVQITDTAITYTPALDLPGGAHEVNLSLGGADMGWKFTVQLPAPAAPASVAPLGSGNFQSGTDAEAPPAQSAATQTDAPPDETPASTAQQNPPAAGANATASPSAIVPQMDTQLGATTQWANSPGQDTNAITFGEQVALQVGPWRIEVNGSGLLSSTFEPQTQQTSLGHVNDYVTRLAYDAGKWGGSVRFGIVSPVLYTDAEFVTAATPRQGVEVAIKSPAGSFAFFANTNDTALGSGSGITFHQSIRGASWDAPIPKKWAEFRLMWLGAQDVGVPATVQFNRQGQPIQTINPVGTPGSGDAYGALLILHLSQSWQWISEYSWTYDNADTSVSGSHRQFGRAWRTGFTGLIKKETFSIMYRDVGVNFETPANPSLTLMSNPDRRGVDFSTQAPTLLGTFTLGYSFLESDVFNAQIPEAEMHAVTEAWAKPLTPTTVLTFNAHETLTVTGNVPAAVQSLPLAQQLLLEADQRDYGANVGMTRQIGKVSLTLQGARDWYRNNNVTGLDTITSSIIGSANWAGPQWFQMNVNLSVNWLSADAATTGLTRTLSGYVQPTFLYKTFQILPLISTNTVRTQMLGGVLAADTLTGQYGGRVAWTMPGRLKFSVLSFEGDHTNNRDNVTGTNFNNDQMLGVWTLTWNRHVGPR